MGGVREYGEGGEEEEECRKSSWAAKKLWGMVEVVRREGTLWLMV